MFMAECDPFCAMQARFEFDLAGSEDLVVNTKPQVVPRLSRTEYLEDGLNTMSSDTAPSYTEDEHCVRWKERTLTQRYRLGWFRL